MIRSGIAPLDDRLGGLAPDRIHLLVGAPGSGKSSACLHFLHAGLRIGETVVLITTDQQCDLHAHASHLGLDLRPPLRDGRLILLRYRAEFSRRFARVLSPDVAFDEIRRLLGATHPTRIAVDPLTPLLVEGSASSAGIAALTRFLDESGATSLVTYTGELGQGYDRRLEPLLARAAAIVRVVCEEDGCHRMDFVKVRHSIASGPPVRFSINRGQGIERRAAAGARATGSQRPFSRRLLVLRATATPADELLALLTADYEVTCERAPAGAANDLALDGLAAVLVDVNHEAYDTALTLVRDLGRRADAPPIVLVTRFNLRSSDRARALRTGADDFLAGDLGPAEFLFRLADAIQRGRRPSQPAGAFDEVLIAQPSLTGEGLLPLDEAGFARALAAHVARDRPLRYTVVSFVVTEGNAPDLADLAMRSMRATGGDLAALVGDRVTVYLHGARRRDSTAFVERVRERWARRGAGTLRIETASSPAEESQLPALVEARSRP